MAAVGNVTPVAAKRSSLADASVSAAEAMARATASMSISSSRYQSVSSTFFAAAPRVAPRPASRPSSAVVDDEAALQFSMPNEMHNNSAMPSHQSCCELVASTGLRLALTCPSPDRAADIPTTAS
eukprot:scaffold67410_cov19-Prasinocladus_malaysianus.AAC.1